MSQLLYVLLMAPQGGDQSPYSSLIFIGLIFVIFYFFMIRPQMKKQKDTKKFREELKNGDKVLTIGGIYGKILEVREKVVILEVEDKVRLKVDKTAIAKDSSDLNAK
ncbi:MAG: preprotein translocase subunit YajC [Chlorobi bacterium]|nr:preprotein translocase subunit YajC [Chlorobiota bacterium]